MELMRCSSHTAQLMLDRAPVTWHCSSLTALGFDGQHKHEPILCENDCLWRHSKLGQKILHQDFLFPDPSATVCFVKLDIGRCMFLLDAISGPDMQQTGSAALVVGLRHQVQNLSLVVTPLERKPPLQHLVEKPLETKPPFSDVVNAEEDLDPDSIAEDRRQPNNRKGYHWPIFMILQAVLLSYYVHDPGDIAAVVSASIGVALPIHKSILMQAKLTDELPSRNVAYHGRIKLDFMLALYQRRLFKKTQRPNPPHRYSSQLMSDASDQSRYDYFNTVEERMYLAPTDAAVVERGVQDGFLNCFDMERRTLPVTVVGKGVGSASAKTGKVLHQLCLEVDAVDLPARRSTVCGWLSDQAGDTLKVGDVPSPVGTECTADLLQQLRAGTISLASDKACKSYFSRCASQFSVHCTLSSTHWRRH